MGCLLTLSHAWAFSHHSSNFTFDPSYSPESVNISTFFEYNKVDIIMGAITGTVLVDATYTCRCAI